MQVGDIVYTIYGNLQPEVIRAKVVSVSERRVVLGPFDASGHRSYPAFPFRSQYTKGRGMPEFNLTEREAWEQYLRGLLETETYLRDKLSQTRDAIIKTRVRIEGATLS